MINKEKKLAIVIASKNFRDEEYFETKGILELNGFELETFSDKKGLAVGKLGGTQEVLKSICDLKENDFMGVIFVGGGGAIDFLDNKDSYKIVRAFFKKDKLVAAICIAPVILANTGVLKGKRVTVFPDEHVIKSFKDMGIVYINEKSVIDGNIVTANGPNAIKEFCGNILTLF